MKRNNRNVFKKANTIGLNIRYLRLKRGFTQEGLAIAIGRSSRAWISDIENGRVLPSLIALCDMAYVLKVTPAVLLLDASMLDAHYYLTNKRIKSKAGRLAEYILKNTEK